MEDSKLVIAPYDLSMGKEYVRELLALATQNFLDLGGKITICRPAFAYGCETPSCVRQAVRKEWRA
jgi:hypothetical protein